MFSAMDLYCSVNGEIPEGDNMTGKHFILLAILVLALSLFVSCEESSNEAGANLSIVLDDGAKTRTIMPSSTLMEIRKYSVSGSGPSGQTFGPLISTSSEISVSEILPGSWTLQAQALNAENNEISSGSGTFDIRRGPNNVTIALDTITGSGSLQLDLNWAADISDYENITLTVVVKDMVGNQIATDSKVVATSAGSTSMVLNLPAGCHVMSVRMSDEEGSLDAGATDAVRILSNTRSTGSVQLQSSKYNALMSITLENRVGSPMSFYIDYSPKNAEVGEFITLSALYDALPAGVSASDLSYQWYKDGVLCKTGGNGTYTVTVQAGLHRYDVIVGSNMAGTLCGASLVLNSGGV